MSRCYACCQENCGYTHCTCDCHTEEDRKARMKPKGNCPKCGHPLWEHYDEKGHDFKCWERMSYDNNDFCGCRHGAPPSPTFTFYAIADNEDITKAWWYRTYSQYKGSGYVKDLEDAKIWVRKGQAQAKCTNLGAGAFLVEFVAGKVNVIDQRERLAQAAEKKRQEEERRRQSAAERELADAERALKMAQEKVQRLRKG